MGVMGYELVARALQQQGVDTFFFIMGAEDIRPALERAAAAVAAGRTALVNVRTDADARAQTVRFTRSMT